MDHLDQEQIDKLTNLLRELSGDAQLFIEKISKGSLRLHVNISFAAIHALQDATETGRLSFALEELGIKCEAISFLPVMLLDPAAASLETVIAVPRTQVAGDRRGISRAQFNTPEGQYAAEKISGALVRFSNFSMLGASGLGAVFSAWDRVRKQNVALKIIRNDIGHTARLFEQEYQILASRRHPQLVRVYDIGTCEIKMADGSIFEHLWYTMQLCSKSLASSFQSMVPAARSAAMLQVLDGLSALHEQGIAHRDIRPTNLFMTEQNSVKIGNFGLTSGILVSGLSSIADGIVLGAPQYLAPERWERALAPYDDWKLSDQYAAGITLFEILSRGGHPLDLKDASIDKCYNAHLRGNVRPLIVPELPGARFPAIDAIIDRMTKKDASARYSNLPVCRLELETALARDGFS
jgi:hypothetical protein